MARYKILYIELKTDHGNSGPAWIGQATLSSSGRTIYFNGKALKRIKCGGISGNHSDIENGDEYWVSGIKKNGEDRHWAGGGIVMVDARILDEYLAFRGVDKLNPTYHKVVTIKETDISRFHEIENEGL